jgi:calcineurin-like phosphoesterase family protein
MVKDCKRIWFSSDWHCGHTNVLEFCNRPFDSLDNMHEQLVSNWNSVVQPDDTAYLLGDMFWKSNFLYLAHKMHGNLHLIVGNHDSTHVSDDRIWQSTHHYLRLKVNEHRLILCHYPIESWHGQQHKAIHLHGHTHADKSHLISVLKNRFDVGVDSWGMYPVSLDTILKNTE